ncbi:hypothetical protein PG990_006278 [Apiospora arundinis]
MNGSHLPAGQPMPGGVGGVPGGRGPVDMGHVPAAGNGPRRQRPQHYPSHQPSYYHQQHHNVHNPMYYSTPMNPYATSYYPQQMPHYYQNSHMPAAQYVPHHPPTRRGLLRLCTNNILLSCLRPSPAISTPPVYATALPPPPVPVPQAPSSTQSPQPAAQPPLTPSTPHTQASSTPPLPPQPEMEIARQPFKPPLPWLSRPDLPFPTKTAKSKRRRKILTTDASNVRLPTNHQGGNETSVEPTGSETATNPSAPETPAQSNTTSAISSAATMKSSDSSGCAGLAQSYQGGYKDPKGPSSDDRPDQAPAVSQAPPADASIVSSTDAPVEETQPAAAPAPIKPKLWTGLFANASAAAAAANPGSQVVPGTTISGAVENGEANGNSVAASGPFTKTNASSLAEAIALFRVGKGQKLAFLKPRGLINTGNMCYMNSILQVLIFCTPFYDFLDQVSQKAVHSFKSATPLVDAMIMFMREFHVIDSATSVEQLRMRLKNEELEQYGEPFAPEVVYDAIRKHKRFAEMQRGQQQDAEEFLGFLLESLREECKETMAQHSDSTAATAATPKAGSSPTDTTDSSDWLEVGTKQRAAITRSSGEPHDSLPTTQIFGGKLRSELKKTGCQDSIHYERFQPLQLDIGSPQVRNIIDALRNLTLPETLHDSDSKPGTTKTKQVFIETLPPVLILHLKRFQFDAQSGTGTTKIWKKLYITTERAPAVVTTPSMWRRQDGQEWIRIDDTIIRRVRSEDVAEGGQEENAVKEASRPDQKRDTTSSATGNRFEGISGDSEAGDDEGWNQVATPASGGKKWSNVVNGNRAGAATATAPPPSKGKQVRDSIKDKVAYLLFYQRI